MKCNIYLLMTVAIILTSSFYAQDGSFTMETKKPIYIYRFDGVNYDKMSIKEVSPVKVTTSSTLTSKTNAYKCENLLDHNNATAWVEGQSDNGIGASVLFEFENTDDYPDIIEIFPGYGKDEKTWMSNKKPVSINVTLLSENMEEVIESISLSFSHENDKLPMKSQYVNIASLHVQNMGLTEFKYIKMEIMEVADDSAVYSDMCISTINFYKGNKVIKTQPYKD